MTSLTLIHLNQLPKHHWAILLVEVKKDNYCFQTAFDFSFFPIYNSHLFVFLYYYPHLTLFKTEI